MDTRRGVFGGVKTDETVAGTIAPAEQHSLHTLHLPALSGVSGASDSGTAWWLALSDGVG